MSEYSQSYNRYSYCFNNPLRFTDPSGYVERGRNDVLNPLNYLRNIETMIGKMVSGNGNSYEINIYGETELKPILPWIKGTSINSPFK